MNMNIVKVGGALVGLALAGAAGAADNNYWHGDASSDATDVKNWDNDAYDTTAAVYFKASDVATDGGDVKSYTVDFGANVVTGNWMTVSCDGAFSYNPIVWTGTTGGYWGTENFYVGGSNEGALDIQSGSHYAKGNAYIGQGTGGKAWLHVGSDATLTTAGLLYIASDTDTGVITNEGHIAVSGQFRVANGSGTAGQYIQKCRPDDGQRLAVHRFHRECRLQRFFPDERRLGDQHGQHYH